MKKIFTMLTAVCCSISAFAQTPTWLPVNGLVAWYPFNGNANDESNHGNNGLVYNCSLTTDRQGNANSAYSFNGGNSYIEVKDTTILRVRKLTLAVWVNSNSNSANQTIIYKAGISGAQGEAFTLNNVANASNISFDFKNNSNCIPNSGWKTHALNTPFSPGNWQFIACTFDGDSVHNYVNGNLVTSYYEHVLIDSCIGGNLRFGYCWNSYPFPFSGKIDDIAIYNRALTACEVLQLYNRNTTKITTQPLANGGPVGGVVQYSVSTAAVNPAYQWQQNAGTGFVNLSNAGPYTGTTTNTLTITNITAAMNNYQYRCIVSAPAVCADTSVNALLKIFSTGIYGVENRNVVIAPNPATEILYLRNLPVTRSGNFTITDLLGRKNISGSLQAGNESINISTLASGTYFLRIEDIEQGFMFIKK